MLNLVNIEEILTGNIGGVQKIEITDRSNVRFDGSATIHDIPFRKNRAKLGEKGSTGPGGYAGRRTVTVEIPKRRTSVDSLLKSLANVDFALRVTDYNDTITRLIPCRINHDYDSGQAMGDSNTYTIQFIGVELFGLTLPAPATVVIQNPDPQVPGVSQTVGNIPPPADPPGSGESNPDLNLCANIIVAPFQTYNDLNANFDNLPTVYSLEVRFDGNVIASALPYTIAATGIYTVAIVTPDCEKINSLYCELETENNDFDVSISINAAGTILSAVITPAITNPAYVWELEQAGGNRIPLGNEVDQILGEPGNYHLTVTETGGGSQAAYYLYQSKLPIDVNISNIAEFAAPYTLNDVFKDASGTSFECVRIILSKINNPAIQLTVTRNGVKLNYTENSPTAVDEYTISGSSIEIWSSVPLNGEDLIITLHI